MKKADILNAVKNRRMKLSYWLNTCFWATERFNQPHMRLLNSWVESKAFKALPDDQDISFVDFIVYLVKKKKTIDHGGMARDLFFDSSFIRGEIGNLKEVKLCKKIFFDAEKIIHTTTNHRFILHLLRRLNKSRAEVTAPLVHALCNAADILHTFDLVLNKEYNDLIKHCCKQKNSSALMTALEKIQAKKDERVSGRRHMDYKDCFIVAANDAAPSRTLKAG